MRLDLEVLALAEDVLRYESRKAYGDEKFSYAERVENIADQLADLIDHLDHDGV